MLYQKIFEELFEREIEYLLVGGMAVNFHGHMRMTVDIDIMLNMNTSNLGKFTKMVQDLGFVPSVPVDLKEILDENIRANWYNSKNMKVLSLQNLKGSEIIDIFIKNPIDFDMAYNNKVVLKPADNLVPIYLVSLDDLIKMKEISGRPQDMDDITVLQEIKEWKKKEN